MCDGSKLAVKRFLSTRQCFFLPLLNRWNSLSVYCVHMHGSRPCIMQCVVVHFAMSARYVL